MSLVFRNQNEQVIRNAEKSRTTTTVSMNKSHAGSNTGPSATRLPTHSPAFSVNEQANCFFRRNYASEFTFLDIPHTEATSAVSLAVAALGLAALANVKMAPSIMMEARKEYTMALSYTNYAIGDSVLSKSDSTLAAVIALGMFEVYLRLCLTGE